MFTLEFDSVESLVFLDVENKVIELDGKIEAIAKKQYLDSLELFAYVSFIAKARESRGHEE